MSTLRFVQIILMAISLLSVVLYLVLFYVPIQFNVPSILYAIEIIRKGKWVYTTSAAWQEYWGSTIEVEIRYPIPALLHASFVLVTGVPLEFSARLPLLALLSVVSYALALALFSVTKNINYKYRLLFSAIYFMYFLYIQIPVLYSGRAHLGRMLLVYLIYLIVIYYIRKLRSLGLLLIALICVTISYTYYTATFALMFMALTLLLLLTLMKIVIKRHSRIFVSIHRTEVFLVLFLVFTINLFILNPFILETARRMGLTPETYMRSVAELVSGHEITQKIKSYVTEAVQYYDPQMIFWKRIAQSVKFSAVLSIILTLLFYIWSKSFREKVHAIIPLYAIMVILIGIGEKLFYRVFGARFEPLLGLILFMIFFNHVLPNISKNNRKIHDLCVIIFILYLIFGCLGMYIESIKYGSVEPSMRSYVDSFAYFTVSYTNTSLKFYTDMASASEIAFLAQVRNKALFVNAIPYLNERIIDAINNGDITLFKERYRSANVKGIFYYKSEIPLKIKGAEFGAGKIIKLHWNLLHYTDVVHSSGKTIFIFIT